jgi:hypothetical protein
MKLKLIVAISLLAIASQAAPAWAADNAGPGTLALGPTDYQQCIWQQIKTGKPCRP